MGDQSSAPLSDININDIGAALAAAGSPSSMDPASKEGGQGAAGSGAAGKGTGGGPVHSLDFILDIPLKVTVELGRTKMAIREVLHLAQGSVVELTKFAGDPLEVLVNDKLIARGEVVVVNEKFGIRLTDIISPVERIEQLK